MILLLLALGLALYAAAAWAVCYPTFLRTHWALVRSPWGAAAVVHMGLGPQAPLFLEAYREAIEARVTGDPDRLRALIDVAVPAIKRDVGWARLRGLVLMSRTVAAVAPIVPFREVVGVPGLGWPLFAVYVVRHWIDTARERARLQAYLLRKWRA